MEISESRWRLLFQHAPTAYFLTDIVGRIIDCNQATLDIIGWAPVVSSLPMAFVGMAGLMIMARDLNVLAAGETFARWAGEADRRFEEGVIDAENHAENGMTPLRTGTARRCRLGSSSETGNTPAHGVIDIQQ